MEKQQLLDLFLSYSAKDRLKVRHLHTLLAHTDGLKPWFDDTILLPGVEWEHEIARAVQESDLILICVSPHIVTKGGKIHEDIIYALNQRQKKTAHQPAVLLVKLEACDVPHQLARFPTVNWFEPDGYEHLITTLQQYTEHPLVALDKPAREALRYPKPEAPHPPPPGEHPQPQRQPPGPPVVPPSPSSGNGTTGAPPPTHAPSERRALRFHSARPVRPIR